MSQLELVVVDEIAKAKNEIAQAISNARGVMIDPASIRVLETQPQILPRKITSLQYGYYHLNARETKIRSKTKIRLTRDQLEIEHETEKISRELDIIEETIAYNTQPQSNQQLISQQHYNGQPLYKQLSSYTVQEQSCSTTYTLFEQASCPSELDVTQLVPDKVIEKLNLPPGLYGFIYLGTNYMAINSNLDTSPAKKEETMIHEAVHTNDEYETRVITWWMLSKDKKYAIVAKRECA